MLNWVWVLLFFKKKIKIAMQSKRYLLNNAHGSFVQYNKESVGIII